MEMNVNRLMDMATGEKERVGGMGEICETYILICKIDSQREFAL